MTEFYPGPYEVEIFYTEGSVEHKQRLNCSIVGEAGVGEPFSAFSVDSRGGAAIALNAAVDAYIALMRPFFASTTNITIANLYKYVANSYDKSFLATYDINQLGSAVGSAQLNHQTFLTFTTQIGNNIKLTWLDDVSSSNSRIPIRDSGVGYQAMATYLVGSTNWILARDGAFPAGRLNFVGGQNEALFKRRNR